MNTFSYKKSAYGLVIISLFSMTGAQGEEVMPTAPRRIERTQPDDTALQLTSERQRELEAVEREIKEKRRSFEAGQPPATLNTAPPAGASFPPASAQSQGEGTQRVLTQPETQGAKTTSKSSGTRKGRATSKKAIFAHPTGVFYSPSGRMGSPLQVFAVSSLPHDESGTFTVLPTGSHVKARIVSGVEANAREPYPVLLQLDYAFTGPNKSRIDLSHCFMIAKARANMSTERVMMETENLSCVREDGEHFKREAKGYVAGSDNTFGATGTYISKQGQVLLAAVLASIAKNAGQAIADAQKTTSVLGLDKAATASNVTSSKAAFIGGSALVDGGAMVAQWYLEQAKELLPSIGVGSGQDVFVVMLDSINVPNLQTEE